MTQYSRKSVLPADADVSDDSAVVDALGSSVLVEHLAASVPDTADTADTALCTDTTDGNSSSTVAVDCVAPEDSVAFAD